MLDEHLQNAGLAGTTVPTTEFRWLTREPDSGIDARIDPANVEVHACGISATVHSLVKAVERLGVPDLSIELEGFRRGSARNRTKTAYYMQGESSRFVRRIRYGF